MARITGLIRQRFLRFRREAVVLWFAFRHPSTPLHLKLACVLLAVYLLSPIDLIPIFIPLFGLLDDLIIVPFGVSLVVKRLPENVLQDTEHDASRWIQRYIKRPLLAAAIFVVALVAFWSAVIYWLVA